MSTDSGSGAVATADGPHGDLPKSEERVLALAKVAGALQRGGVAAVLVLFIVIVIGSLIWPSFHSVYNLRNVLLGNSYIAIVAIGMTLVIISGGIDLSVGSVFALGGVAGTYFASNYGAFAGVAMTVIICGLVGLINGVLISYAGMAPFIVTLAMLFGVRGLVTQVTDAGATVYHVSSTSAFAHLGTSVWLTFGLPVFIAGALYVIFNVVLEHTPFGLTIFAVGGSEPAALLMGLRVRRTKASLYVISAVLAGVAGMLLAAQTNSGDPTVGNGYELQTIAAVVIGGTLLTGGAGSLVGSLAGVLLLGAINSMLAEAQFDTTWNNVVSGAFLVVVVVIQRILVRARQR